MIVSSNQYDLGSLVVLTANFVDTTGAPADPSLITLRILDPNNVETVVEQALIQRLSTGVYTYSLSVMTAGVWFYRFEGEGTAEAVMDDAFVVTSTPFADAAA